MSRTPSTVAAGAVRVPSGLLDYEREHPDRATLLFFTSTRSGPARRMESLIAHLASTQRRRLRVATVDVDGSSELAARFGVEQVPCLVLVHRSRVVGRLVGRASGGQIDELLAGLDA